MCRPLGVWPALGKLRQGCSIEESCPGSQQAGRQRGLSWSVPRLHWLPGCAPHPCRPGSGFLWHSSRQSQEPSETHCPRGRRRECPLSTGPRSPTLLLCLKWWTVPHDHEGKAARGWRVILRHLSFKLPSLGRVHSSQDRAQGSLGPRSATHAPLPQWAHSPPPKGMLPSCIPPRLLGHPGHQQPLARG